jgi:hypothetical protein
MTDEERQKLCKELRADDYADAAEEIERLAQEVAEWKQAAEVEADQVTKLREENKVLWSALPEGTTEVKQRLSELERKAPW